MTAMISIAPVPYYLRTIRSQYNLGWASLLAELIDNAQDAGAKSITLDFSTPGVFVASDDGVGCSDLRLMLAAGCRADHETTQAGQHGIGGKEAIICLANQAEITSVCEGIRRTITVNWLDVMASGRWEVPAPTQTPTPQPSGTCLILRSLIKALPSNYVGAAKEKFGALYAPAITSGAFRIFLRYRAGRGGKVHCDSIAPALLPRLEREESGEFTFPHGRTARFHMGIIAEPDQRVMQGITVAIPTRVIMVRQRFGLGNDPTPGLYGYVELSRGWSLAKNKDDLSPSDRQFIASVIADRFRGLIEFARKSGEDIRLAGCNRALALIPTAIRRERDRTRKARRAPPTHHTGTVLPTGTGRSHTQAARTQPGTRFPGPAASDEQSFTLGYDSMGRTALFTTSEDGKMVTVNTDHDFYKHTGGNTDVLMPLAVLFIAAQLDLKSQGEQKMLPYPETQANAAARQQWACSYLLERYVEALKIASDAGAAVT
jgi:hypothetical protein